MITHKTQPDFISAFIHGNMAIWHLTILSGKFLPRKSSITEMHRNCCICMKISETILRFNATSSDKPRKSFQFYRVKRNGWGTSRIESELVSSEAIMVTSHHVETLQQFPQSRASTGRYSHGNRVGSTYKRGTSQRAGTESDKEKLKT